MRKCLTIGTAWLLAIALTGHCQAQITPPRMLSSEIDRFATLEEQLVNRLRATKDDQKAYIRFVVKQVRNGKLDAKLVVAVERYALRRHRQLPFLFFERALRFEANKRGIALPGVRQFATTKVATGASGTGYSPTAR